MRKRRDPLDRIAIATPCRAGWETMAGDERVRHCTACDLNVYNFAAMTRDEVRELLLRTEGRVCARLYRRADGTLLTRDCPRGLRALRQRASRLASAMMAALVSVAALAGCATTRHRSTMELETEQTAASQQAAFAGVVFDESGAPLPGVMVVVRDEATGRELTTVTDMSGMFHLGSLSEGLYRVEVSLAGFDSALVKNVPLKPSEVTRARVELRLGAPNETITVGAIAVDDPAPLSTTFTKDFVDKLPR